MQTHLRGVVAERRLPYLVLSDYPMLAGSRRSVFADLVIRDKPTGAIVAAEFGYEPEHRRTEFMAMPAKSRSRPGVNTRDLSYVGLDEAVTWCFGRGQGSW